MNREGLVQSAATGSSRLSPQNAAPPFLPPHLTSAHALHFISDTRRGRVFPSVDIINLRQIKSTTRLLGKLRVLIRHLWKSLTPERWRRRGRSGRRRKRRKRGSPARSATAIYRSEPSQHLNFLLLAIQLQRPQTCGGSVISVCCMQNRQA